MSVIELGCFQKKELLASNRSLHVISSQLQHIFIDFLSAHATVSEQLLFLIEWTQHCVAGKPDNILVK